MRDNRRMHGRFATSDKAVNHRQACDCPTASLSLRNYRSDAGAGSNTITVMGEHGALRAALLGTVAAGALWLGTPRAGAAEPPPPICTVEDGGATLHCTGVITGDFTPGVVNGGINVPSNYSRLEVDNVEAHITPDSGVDGISFVRTGAGNTITIISDTDTFDIITEGAGADGIYAKADGSITIDHTGDITASWSGISAGVSDNAADLSIISNGTITATSNFGIVATHSGSGKLSITAEGDVGSTNNVGIYAEHSGSGTLTIRAAGKVSSQNANAIFAKKEFGSDGDLVIEATGGVEGGVIGIAAVNYGSGALNIKTEGDVVGNGSDYDGIPGIFAYSLGNGLSIETESVKGERGIYVLHQGSGTAKIVTHGAILGTRYNGIYVSAGSNPIEITVTSTSSVTSNGLGSFAIRTSGQGGADITVAGTVNGGAGAILFAAAPDRLELHPTAVINGNVLAGFGEDTLALGGEGDGSFDVSKVGTGQQFQSFEIFEKEGASHWQLTGSNDEIDNFTVKDGLLSVNGDLPNAVFEVNGGALGGDGTIGGVVVGAGGIVAPGNSIGTMTVNGNFTLTAGAIFEVEANALGQADKVIVNGTVNLSGAVLRVLAANGAYKPKTDYVIVDNDGADAVEGTFAEITSNLAFLTPSVVYNGGDGNDVVLTLLRAHGPGPGPGPGPKPLSFCSAAVSKNQCNVAHALDLFPTDNELFLAVVTQTVEGARQAFDALSGEIHATLPGVLADDSRYVREAVLGRLVQATYTNNAGQVAALGSGGPQVAALNTYDEQAMALGTGGKHLAPPATSYGAAFWTRAYGAWGDFDGNGNAASADRDLGGFISGVDTQISANWRAGLAAGGAWSSVSVGDRHSNADIDSFNLAGYVGGLAGPLALRGGGSWTGSEIDTSRAVIFPGFFERQDSSYDADTGQLFGEVAYPITSGRIAFEPFAGLAYVSIDTDSFRERGDDLASLTGSSDDEDVGYSTLGLRAATVTKVSNVTVVPKISAAWQHAFDDVTPGASLAFASTGIGFGITGVPLAQDSALLEAGLDFAISANATLGVSYTGQFADEVSDNGIKGRFSWLF